MIGNITGRKPYVYVESFPIMQTNELVDVIEFNGGHETWGIVRGKFSW